MKTNHNFKDREGIETKTCLAGEVKLLNFDNEDSGPGTFEGYASVFNNYDHHNEAVVKGAYADCLKRFIDEGFVANAHNWDSQHAIILDAKEDDIGLWVKGQFHSDPESQMHRTRIRERMAAGKSVKMSIGYRVLDSEPTKQGRLLKKLDLFEVSFVTVPANDLAHVTNIKSRDVQFIDSEEAVDEFGEVKSIDSLLADTSFAKHSEVVLSMAENYAKRARAIQDLRAKEGRVLSSANLEKLTSLRGYLSTVMEALGEIITLATGNTADIAEAIGEIQEELSETPEEEAAEQTQQQEAQESMEEMMRNGGKGCDGAENKADEAQQKTEAVQETKTSTEVETEKKSDDVPSGDELYLEFLRLSLADNLKLGD